MLPKRAICYNTVRSFELIFVVFALYSATTFYRRTPGVRTIFLLRASMSFTHFSLRYLQNGAKQRKLFEAYARCTPSAGTFFDSKGLRAAKYVVLCIGRAVLRVRSAYADSKCFGTPLSQTGGFNLLQVASTSNPRPYSPLQKLPTIAEGCSRRTCNYLSLIHI